MENLIHDIKTERQNVSGGLPSGFKAVPIAFYIGCAASILLSLYFFLSKKAYESREAVMTQRLSEATANKTQFVSKQQSLVNESKRAEGFAAWLEGAHPLQPVIATVARTMGKDSTIAELSLNRNPEIPAHTFMQLNIDGGGSQQIESTLSEIYALNYLTYSAQQVKGRNSTDFQATLIFNDK